MGRKSEFGFHEDGLESLQDISEEEKRTDPRRRKQGKKFIGAEDVASTEPDPLARLIAKEEAPEEPEDDPVEEVRGSSDLREPANNGGERIFHPREVDEKTLQHGATGETMKVRRESRRKRQGRNLLREEQPR